MAKNSQRLKHNCVGEKKEMQTNRVKNPGKQRKRLYNAPAHVRHKLMAAPLSKELVAKHGVKTLPVRKGDTVHIQRGDNKGFEGKISRVDLKSYRIYIEGLTREKVDGTNIFLPVHPSKVMIRNLSLDDNRRKAVIGRKKPIEKPAKAAAKPVKKPAPAKAPEKPQPKPQPKVEEVVEVPEEKPVAPPAPVAVVEEKAAAPKVAKEEAPQAKKPAAKKPAVKAAPAKKAPAKEEAPVKKEAKAKPKAAAKKAPAAKAAPAKGAASKSRAKPKTSKKTEGGQ
jgi:large subunit ribosomal protein L24